MSVHLFRDLSDQDITQQFLAALPRPERAPPRQKEEAGTLQEGAALRQEEAAPPQQEAATKQEGPLPEIRAADSGEGTELSSLTDERGTHPQGADLNVAAIGGGSSSLGSFSFSHPPSESVDVQAAFLTSMSSGGAAPNGAAVDGVGGGDSAESANLEQAARTLMVSGDDSSVQGFEPLPVGELDAAAASRVSTVDESVTGSGSSDGKPPAKEMQQNE